MLGIRQLGDWPLVSPDGRLMIQATIAIYQCSKQINSTKVKEERDFVQGLTHGSYDEKDSAQSQVMSNKCSDISEPFYWHVLWRKP
jgi:hypothetical protein